MRFPFIRAGLVPDIMEAWKVHRATMNRTALGLSWFQRDHVRKGTGTQLAAPHASERKSACVKRLHSKSIRET